MPEDRPPSRATPEDLLSEQVFRREGDYWTVIYAGTTVRLRDAIGVRYLARLLAHPNQPIPVEDLLSAVKGGNAVADAERARSAVGKRIRDTLRKIQQHHPALGYHLVAGIKTGTHCIYRPDPERPGGWTT